MNETEAKEIANDPNSMDHKLGFAEGYLECLEKARGLEKALEKISKYECDCFSSCGPCLDITNQVAAEALAKWQEEK